MKRPAPNANGFSLVEIIIVLALISLITGVAAPAIGTMVDSKTRRTTRLEMEQLAEAVVHYFEDTLTLPAGPLELVTSTTPGWAGPYVAGTFTDPISGNNGYVVDAWSNPYVFTIVGDTLTIESRGKDGIAGNTDDLALPLDVTLVRRAETLAELRTIQIAIDAYNAIHLATNPLPANYVTIHARLVADGLLPAGGGYDSDAWGIGYVPDPAGVAPVTRVTSSNL